MIDALTSHLIDAAVVLGLAVVAPLALGRWRRWALAAGLAALALTLPRGAAAGLVAAGPAAIAALGLHRQIAAAEPIKYWCRDDIVRVLAGTWALVATGALVASRSGLTLFGIGEPIVELTAVHYLFAGVGALTLAGTTRSTVAVTITAAAPPVVAIGFVTAWAAPQVGGAVLMAIGVFVIAALELRAAIADRRSPWSRRALLAISGLAVWAPMFFAVAWAAGQHWNVPALSVPAMVRWHGAPNAIGFVIAGLAAARMHIPARRVTACA
ncbi:MAG TPA: YndJ family transporter [Acidimicrobiales bacterium]|nr:YndJ family transporter [Acidimicrobiales bacterium]